MGRRHELQALGLGAPIEEVRCRRGIPALVPVAVVTKHCHEPIGFLVVEGREQDAAHDAEHRRRAT